MRKPRHGWLSSLPRVTQPSAWQTCAISIAHAVITVLSCLGLLLRTVSLIHPDYYKGKLLWAENIEPLSLERNSLFISILVSFSDSIGDFAALLEGTEVFSWSWRPLSLPQRLLSELVAFSVAHLLAWHLQPPVLWLWLGSSVKQGLQGDLCTPVIIGMHERSDASLWLKGTPHSQCPKALKALKDECVQVHCNKLNSCSGYVHFFKKITWKPIFPDRKKQRARIHLCLKMSFVNKKSTKGFFFI